jgi:hypothetical protein
LAKRHGPLVSCRGEAGHQSRSLPDLYLLPDNQLFGTGDCRGVIIKYQINSRYDSLAILLKIVETKFWHLASLSRQLPRASNPDPAVLFP